VNAEGTPSKPPSRSTLYRMLKKHGLTNQRSKIRPKLTSVYAKKRRAFRKEYRHFTWGRCMFKFSDECSVQKGFGHNTEWCFRFPWERWKKEMVTEVGTSRKPAQMVWAMVWIDKRGCARRSDLIIMERDLDAKNCDYSSQSYIQALRKGLLPHWRRTQLFMHDNACIHTSKVVREFLADHHINPIIWPPYSSDLNPIKHLWRHLKKRMHKSHPQYSNYSTAEEEWDGFCNALKECWRSIPHN
jgi:transposase